MKCSESFRLMTDERTPREEEVLPLDAGNIIEAEAERPPLFPIHPAPAAFHSQIQIGYDLPSDSEPFRVGFFTRQIPQEPNHKFHLSLGGYQVEVLAYNRTRNSANLRYMHFSRIRTISDLQARVSGDHDGDYSVWNMASVAALLQLVELLLSE